MRKFSRITDKLAVSRLRHKIKVLEKKYYAEVLLPEDLTEGFDDLIGMKSEKEILKDALNFFKGIGIYTNGDSPLQPNTRYLLAGAPGSGKSPLIKALAKEANVPLIVFAANTFNDYPESAVKIINLIFDVVNSFSDGCILTFENFLAISDTDNEPIKLLHNHLASKIHQNVNAVIIIQTASETLQMPSLYFKHNMFNVNKIVRILPPTLESRKELFIKYLKNCNIELDDSLVERLAKNTMGMYPKDIEYVVHETLLRAVRNETLNVSFKDFQETLLQMDAGSEHHSKLTEEERTATAYHEAGHVIAAYYSNPKYILGRVEITPRAQSLGLTLEESGEEKYSYFKKDYEYQIIYSLGGMAAEKLIYDQTSAGVSADLATANAYAFVMITNVGMSEELGPIVLDDECGFSSEMIYSKAELIVQKLLKDLFQQTYSIVSAHKPQLEALAKALLEHEVLVGDEIKNVLIASEETEKNKE